VDKEKFLYYNCMDTTCTFEIRDAIWDEFQATNNSFAYDNTVGIYNALIYMMTRGIKVDFDALEATRRDVIEDRNKKQAELDELCGHPQLLTEAVMRRQL